MIHTYDINGMHCRGCAGALSATLQKVPGVSDVVVTLDPPRAEIQMSAHVSSNVLNEAASKAGAYTLTETPVTKAPAIDAEKPMEAATSLAPLFIVVGYIAGGVLLRSGMTGDFSFHTLMANFMGAFFVVFSLFKMINLAGFADGYATYDIIAKRSRGYALAYPFIELALGIAFLIGAFPLITNLVTLFIMSIGSIGVGQALREKRAIQCACLGTALRLPMTKVTLAEDALMAAMALAMLIVQWT